MEKKMAEFKFKELRRRSLVKSLLWRVIGVVWTWIGAYLILLLVPPSQSSAALIATLIVVYHHSTRMIMYYAYERIWTSVAWGRETAPRPMSLRERQEYIVSAFPGVGPTLAKPLLEMFGSVRNVVNACPDALKSVEKIGEKRAKEIQRVLTEEYSVE